MLEEQIGLVDCSLRIAPDTFLDTVRYQKERCIEDADVLQPCRLQTKGRGKGDASTSIAFKRSLSVKKYNTSFMRTECTTYLFIGPSNQMRMQLSGVGLASKGLEQCLRFALCEIANEITVDA
eukprot:IDg14088t1